MNTVMNTVMNAVMNAVMNTVIYSVINFYKFVPYVITIVKILQKMEVTEPSNKCTALTRALSSTWSQSIFF